MSKVPVFDIGDTLFPTVRFFREAVRGETDREDFRIGNFNIFDPKESEKYFSEKGVKINGKKVSKNYIEKVQSYMRENRLEFLSKCCEEFGPIGVISDNWSYAETFYSDMFKEHSIDFEGIIISEVVGSTKPEEEIFNKFLNQRKRGAEDFVYFGNHGRRDAAATNVGMDFVFTTEYNNFGTKHQGREISKLTFENVRKEVTR